MQRFSTEMGRNSYHWKHLRIKRLRLVTRLPKLFFMQIIVMCSSPFSFSMAQFSMARLQACYVMTPNQTEWQVEMLLLKIRKCHRLQLEVWNHFLFSATHCVEDKATPWPPHVHFCFFPKIFQVNLNERRGDDCTIAIVNSHRIVVGIVLSKSKQSISRKLRWTKPVSK